MTKIIFVDVDGTIADNSVRYEKAFTAGPARSPAWKKIVSNPALIAEDVPLPGAVRALTALHESGVRIVYLSGRLEKERAVTQEWLFSNGFPGGGLVLNAYRKKAEFIRDIMFMRNADEAVFVDNDTKEIDLATASLGDLNVTIIQPPHTESGYGTVKSDFWKRFV